MSTILAIVIGVAVTALLAWQLRTWRRRGRTGDYGRWVVAGVGGTLTAQVVSALLGTPLRLGSGERAVPGGALAVAVILGTALGIAFARGARLTGGWRELERTGRRGPDA